MCVSQRVVPPFLLNIRVKRKMYTMCHQFQSFPCIYICSISRVSPQIQFACWILLLLGIYEFRHSSIRHQSASRAQHVHAYPCATDQAGMLDRCCKACIDGEGTSRIKVTPASINMVKHSLNSALQENPRLCPSPFLLATAVPRFYA
jgi:hypothetical protein